MTEPPTPVTHRVRLAIEEVLDATGTGWRALLAGCLVVGLAAGALVWLTRQAPEPIESTLPVVEPETVTTTTAPPGPVIVHVAGEVARPGVQELPAGSRVIDAVDAAGGVTADADAGRVNLAAELGDGVQVYIPAVGEAAPPVAASGTEAGTAGDDLVDLNVAGGSQLEELPGVGPATAAAIIDHRERAGPFATVDDLLDVRGIGEAKLAALRDLVRV
ncbi:MAG: helix-hairpin-helix domain-containing protein [Acidimicrobiales bacterium]|nr:helix-hairpin-helix domain-containing protein [Acidimicrobiales bacterium]